MGKTIPWQCFYLLHTPNLIALRVKMAIIFQFFSVIQREASRVEKLTMDNQFSELLLYIEFTISFLIGRKRTVNLRNQRL